MDLSTLVLTYTEGENEYELLDDSQFLYPFSPINFSLQNKGFFFVTNFKLVADIAFAVFTSTAEGCILTYDDQNL